VCKKIEGSFQVYGCNKGEKDTRHNGQSRRHFLKLLTGGAAWAGAVMVGLPMLEAQAKANQGDLIEESVFPASGQYVSTVFRIQNKFNAVGTYWEVNNGDGNKLVIEIRVSDDGAKFSDWFQTGSDNEDLKDGNSTRYFAALVLATGQYVQYRLKIEGLSLKKVGLTFIDTTGVPPAESTPEPYAPVAPNSPPYIIKRSQWGANENFRYAGGREIWERSYVKPKVLIVHHSETANTYNADPSADVRGIYYYHAVSKGWGDIGYNFLIDWKGNVYEGRAGGNDVVGGHASQYNWGSVGVCLIGSYKSTKPTTAQYESLVRLLSWKASTLNINPYDRFWFVDKNNVPAVCGHRDVMSTTCPGGVMYDQLGDLRNRIAQNLSLASGEYKAEIMSLSFSSATTADGGVITVNATIKNTGTKAMETQDPPPGYVYGLDSDYISANFPKINNKFRLTIDFAGNKGNARPYRWGLGKTLQPGEETTVTGQIRVRNTFEAEFFGGVIQEFVKYHVDNYGRTTVKVQGTPGGGNNPTNRANPKGGDSLYFNEVGHNLGGAFRRFWEQNGGLPIFGFPLTEEFQEVSPTDGKTYTVQYFERNRFEHHPENAGTKFEVLMGLLGAELTKERNFPKTQPFPDEPGVRIYFPQTGHRLDGAFLRYWNQYGGLPIFGFPISEPFEERNPDDGKMYIVQYFERNRFEYHPENRGTRYEVLLGLLGKDVLRRKGWIK
jgi:hypothetical protein